MFEIISPFYMLYLAKLVRNRNFILILALILGLLVGKAGASLTQPAVLPLLILVMTLSAMNVKSSDFLSLKRVPPTMAYSILLNYVLLGGLLLLIAYWLIDDHELWVGFVLLAAVPPAVAVTPFSHSLGGNTHFALIGMTTCYIAAIGIIPLGILFLLGVDYFDPLELLLILGELVVIPILASRVLLITFVGQRIAPVQGTILNWSFFFIIFTLIGLNRHAFLSEFDILIKICAIAFITTFVLGYLIELVCKAAGVHRDIAISAILMGTLKNYALAGGISLSLFSERSTIPSSICVMFGVLMIVWLGFHLKKYKSG